MSFVFSDYERFKEAYDLLIELDELAVLVEQAKTRLSESTSQSSSQNTAAGIPLNNDSLTQFNESSPLLPVSPENNKVWDTYLKSLQSSKLENSLENLKRKRNQTNLSQESIRVYNSIIHIYENLKCIAYPKEEKELTAGQTAGSQSLKILEEKKQGLKDLLNNELSESDSQLEKEFKKSLRETVLLLQQHIEKKLLFRHQLFLSLQRLKAKKQLLNQSTNLNIPKDSVRSNEENVGLISETPEIQFKRESEKAAELLKTYIDDSLEDQKIMRYLMQRAVFPSAWKKVLLILLMVFMIAMACTGVGALVQLAVAGTFVLTKLALSVVVFFAAKLALTPGVLASLSLGTGLLGGFFVAQSPQHSVTFNIIRTLNALKRQAVNIASAETTTTETPNLTHPPEKELSFKDRFFIATNLDIALAKSERTISVINDIYSVQQAISVEEMNSENYADFFNEKHIAGTAKNNVSPPFIVTKEYFYGFKNNFLVFFWGIINPFRLLKFLLEYSQDAIASFLQKKLKNNQISSNGYILLHGFFHYFLELFLVPCRGLATLMHWGLLPVAIILASLSYAFYWLSTPEKELMKPELTTTYIQERTDEIEEINSSVPLAVPGNNLENNINSTPTIQIEQSEQSQKINNILWKMHDLEFRLAYMDLALGIKTTVNTGNKNDITFLDYFFKLHINYINKNPISFNIIQENRQSQDNELNKNLQNFNTRLREYIQFVQKNHEKLQDFYKNSHPLTGLYQEMWRLSDAIKKKDAYFNQLFNNYIKDVLPSSVNNFSLTKIKVEDFENELKSSLIALDIKMIINTMLVPYIKEYNSYLDRNNNPLSIAYDRMYLYAQTLSNNSQLLGYLNTLKSENSFKQASLEKIQPLLDGNDIKKKIQFRRLVFEYNIVHQKLAIKKNENLSLEAIFPNYLYLKQKVIESSRALAIHGSLLQDMALPYPINIQSKDNNIKHAVGQYNEFVKETQVLQVLIVSYFKSTDDSSILDILKKEMEFLVSYSGLAPGSVEFDTKGVASFVQETQKSTSTNAKGANDTDYEKSVNSLKKQIDFYNQLASKISCLTESNISQNQDIVSDFLNLRQQIYLLISQVPENSKALTNLKKIIMEVTKDIFSVKSTNIPLELPLISLYFTQSPRAYQADAGATALLQDIILNAIQYNRLIRKHKDALTTYLSSVPPLHRLFNELSALANQENQQGALKLVPPNAENQYTWQKLNVHSLQGKPFLYGLVEHYNDLVDNFSLRSDKEKAWHQLYNFVAFTPTPFDVQLQQELLSLIMSAYPKNPGATYQTILLPESLILKIKGNEQYSAGVLGYLTTYNNPLPNSTSAEVIFPQQAVQSSGQLLEKSKKPLDLRQLYCFEKELYTRLNNTKYLHQKYSDLKTAKRNLKSNFLREHHPLFGFKKKLFLQMALKTKETWGEEYQNEIKFREETQERLTTYEETFLSMSEPLEEYFKTTPLIRRLWDQICNIPSSPEFKNHLTRILPSNNNGQWGLINVEWFSTIIRDDFDILIITKFNEKVSCSYLNTQQMSNNPHTVFNQYGQPAFSPPNTFRPGN